MTIPFSNYTKLAKVREHNESVLREAAITSTSYSETLGAATERASLISEREEAYSGFHVAEELIIFIIFSVLVKSGSLIDHPGVPKTATESASFLKEKKRTLASMLRKKETPNEEGSEQARKQCCTTVPDGRRHKLQRHDNANVLWDIQVEAVLIRHHSTKQNKDHHCTSENRVESRDYKDSRDPKVDNRDFKGETRDMYAESRVEPQSGKGVRIESREDDSKEVKHDRKSHMEFKGDVKIDKDAYNAGNSPLNWKDPREQHRGKRYPEATTHGIDTWCNSRSTTQGTSEIGEKHRDWGERDKDRIDRQSNLPLGNSSSEHREITREERESERWERDRKDVQKEKERPKEREKNHIKKETLNGIEKEGLHNEKESADGSIRTPELENPAVEQRRQKEHDGWKAGDRESKDRKKERDVESEGDRHENKETDEGLMEGDRGTEKEREGFSFGVQQRKRMLQPRGSQVNW
ncbi:hypothetical protein IFM89_032648 [Coptis chinensis]|uniref:Uncharacterized protein n=1 Tax=Coptis chinensis TaxID=261450 RepID=A0A835HTF8_9MAGN|nr:hypothetical protein IFM89_032648 [Coptis chinensis]